MVSIGIFRSLALQLEESSESPHFEKTSFRVKNKIFATLDEKTKRAVLKLDVVNQSVFSAFDKTSIYPVDGAWGKQGWTAVELKKVRKDLLKDALNIAHSLVTPKKRLSQKTK